MRKYGNWLHVLLIIVMPFFSLPLSAENETANSQEAAISDKTADSGKSNDTTASDESDDPDELMKTKLGEIAVPVTPSSTQEAGSEVKLLEGASANAKDKEGNPEDDANALDKLVNEIPDENVTTAQKETVKKNSGKRLALAKDKNEQKIAELKTAIQNEFGVTIFEGPRFKGQKITKELKYSDGLTKGDKYYLGDAEHWKESKWTLKELKQIQQTLGSLPEGFVASTKAIAANEVYVEMVPDKTFVDLDENGKPKRDEKGKFIYEEFPKTKNSITGVVYKGQSTVNLFKKSIHEDAAERKGDYLTILKINLIHEMTHAFQNEHLDVDKAWSDSFWGRFTPTDSEGLKIFYKETFPNGVDKPSKLTAVSANITGNHQVSPNVTETKCFPWKRFTANFFWERGQSVSIYGGHQQRTSPAAASRIGCEDMAESAVMAVMASDKMKQIHPNRHEFLKQKVIIDILPSADFKSDCEKFAANPDLYGFGVHCVYGAKDTYTIKTKPPSGMSPELKPWFYFLADNVDFAKEGSKVPHTLLLEQFGEYGLPQ